MQLFNHQVVRTAFSNTILRNVFFVVLIFSNLNAADAQYLNKKQVFSKSDTLRGSIGPGRLRWNVLKYEVTVEPDFTSKTIRGKNKLSYYDSGVSIMQIDLQEPMHADSMIIHGKAMPFTRDGNALFVQVRDPNARYKIKPGKDSLLIYFSGKPREAVRPPWDGGWIWKKDHQNHPWISVACQGIGASVWYPCKDIQSDEPDEGASLTMIVPDSLVAIANGRFTTSMPYGDGKMLYSWTVKNPINSYNLVPYIGKYVNFKEVFAGVRGNLDMSYWVLDYNLEKAKEHFKDASRMMKAFEYWFGPYPFYKDGYKLIEAPHLGMEHQSAIAYGNGFQNGYLGSDRSGTGWGKKFDFIIVHESGHEWFANNITSKDIADMWIHEGFTSYSETLFIDYYYGTEAGNAYVVGQRRNIANDIPIIGQYGVNKEGSSDMYDKAANMIHMIRQIVNNDKKFRELLIGLNKTYYHQTVTTNEIESYITKKTKIDLSKLFDQYLRTVQIPVLEYKQRGYSIEYRYANCVKGFNLPLKIKMKNVRWIKPTETWQKLHLYPAGDTELTVDPNFYIKVKKVD